MIFNTVSDYDNGVVQESPYECGLYGAMMHVYENECNYNAMMKAVGLSELKYYQETGGDLFVQEAGALSGFIAKAKQFFKKVIEKIKALFHKFAATINQFTMKDKDFVKKYEKELVSKNLDNFEFEGYTFPGVYAGPESVIKLNKADEAAGNTSDAQYKKDADINNYKPDRKADNKAYDSDSVIDMQEKRRAALIDESGSMDESEFRDKLKEKFYGDSKETLENINIRMQLNYINDANKTIRNIEKLQKETVKKVDDYIKQLEKAEKEVGSGYSRSEESKEAGYREKATAKLNYNISLWKSSSNDYTIAFGMAIQAAKDCNRQAKAICVKAISYKSKNESASVYQSEGAYDDIFGDVKIV